MIMRTYDTLSLAVKALQEEGYTEDFQFKQDCIACEAGTYAPNAFTVEEVHRFEGMTNPSDSSILFAIRADDGRKGLLIDAYGAYADPLSLEMLKKLQFRPN